ATAIELQREIKARTPAHDEIGRVSLGMSIGVESGPIDIFRVGLTPPEHLVCGPTTTATLNCEGAANRGEILLGPNLAAALPPDVLAPDPRGMLLVRAPQASATTVAAPDDVHRSLLSPRVVSHLEAGAVAEHRRATVGFIRASGIDSMLAAHTAAEAHA